MTSKLDFNLMLGISLQKKNSYHLGLTSEITVRFFNHVFLTANIILLLLIHVYFFVYVSQILLLNKQKISVGMEWNCGC